MSFKRSEPMISNTLISQNQLSHGIACLEFGLRSTAVLKNVTIANNQVVDNGDNTPALLAVGPNADVTLFNSIIWGHEKLSFLHTEKNGALKIEYSDIDTLYTAWGNYTKDSKFSFFWGEGNIVLDPKFCHPETNNFTLQASSPCIDAGYPDAQFNDPEDKAAPGYALWPAMGTVRSDMGAFGGSELKIFVKSGKARNDKNFPSRFFFGAKLSKSI
jgi:hypothetical protein